MVSSLLSNNSNILIKFLYMSVHSAVYKSPLRKFDDTLFPNSYFIGISILLMVLEQMIVFIWFLLPSEISFMFFIRWAILRNIYVLLRLVFCLRHFAISWSTSSWLFSCTGVAFPSGGGFFARRRGMLPFLVGSRTSKWIYLMRVP